MMVQDGSADGTPKNLVKWLPELHFEKKWHAMSTSIKKEVFQTVSQAVMADCEWNNAILIEPTELVFYGQERLELPIELANETMQYLMANETPAIMKHCLPMNRVNRRVTRFVAGWCFGPALGTGVASEIPSCGSSMVIAWWDWRVRVLEEAPAEALKSFTGSWALINGMSPNCCGVHLCVESQSQPPLLAARELGQRPLFQICLWSQGSETIIPETGTDGSGEKQMKRCLF